MKTFEGPLEDLWKMPDLPNLKHLSWDWWWWLVMWPSKKKPGISEQLMVLWSTKETPSIFVNEQLTVKDPFRVIKGMIDDLESKTDMIILLFNAS